MLQSHELPAEAVSTTLNPWQKVTGPPAVMVATGFGFIVTFTAGEVLIQLPVVTVTVNEPDALTVIDCVVAPLLHI